MVKQRGKSLVIIRIFLTLLRHGWLHSIVDDPPTNSNYQNSIAYSGHIENVTGTTDRYAPYNTTKPKIGRFDNERAGFKSLGDKIKESI